MKSGDYLIHIYIQEGRQFKLDGAVTVDPKVEVIFNGKSQFTSSKQDIPCESKTSLYWREHLFFEPKQMSSSEIAMQTVQIKLKNKGMFRDELIGEYAFDITTIYFRDNHTLEHQWIALSNPESSNFSSVQGILRVSITVQAEGDEQINLQDPVESACNPDQVILIPASIKKVYKQLKISFLLAEYLPKLDMVGSIDAFIKMSFGGKQYKSSPAVTQKDNRAPINYQFWVPLQWPLSTDRLIIQVYDEDVQFDEIVGSMHFSLADLTVRAAVPGGILSWYNIYGAPINKIGEVTNAMDNNPEIASTWKGRILMQISCEDALNPEMKCQALDQLVITNAIDRKMQNASYTYQILAEVGLGVQLPADKKYKVKIQIGETVLLSDAPKQNNLSYNRWHVRIPANNQPLEFKTSYPSVEMMDQIFVYLMDDETPISYWRGSASDFTNPNPKYRWCIMSADGSIGKITEDHEAGIIQVKISINDVAKNGLVDFMQQPAWQKLPPKRNKQVVKIRCFIFQCKDIPSANDDGLSDCYIKLWNQDGSKIETRSITDSINPVFYETKELIYQYTTLEDAPPLILNLWDKNGLLKNDKYLGRAVIRIQDASTNIIPDDGFGDALPKDVADSIPKPKWHDIRLGNDRRTPATGQILCSFIIAPSDQNFSFPITSNRLRKSIPTLEYNIDIHCFGMRQLQSFGLMPIRKPFIKFHIKSLLPYEKAMAVTNVRTEPVNGPDPNINTLLTFTASLPEETLYCPKLTCEVFDFIFLGLNQPIIGSFDIDLGKIKEDDLIQRNKSFENIQNLIDYLKQHQEKSLQQAADDLMQLKIVSDPDLANLIQAKKSVILENKGLTPINRAKSPSRLQNQLPVIPSPKPAPKQKGEYSEHIDEEDPYRMNEIVQSEVNPAILQKEERVKELEEKVQILETKNQKYRMDPTTTSKMQIDLEISLKRQLMQAKIDLKEEQQRHHKMERKADQAVLRQQGEYRGGIIMLPKYRFEKEPFSLYREIDAPPESLYMRVGFNSQTTIKKLVSELQEKVANTDANCDDFCQAITEEKRQQYNNDQAMKLSHLHYRKYYKDELENIKSIFHQSIFEKIDIKRGATRGVKQSWFSKKKRDDSGQLSDRRTVGLFKGLIEITNPVEKQAAQVRRKKMMDEIYEQVKLIYVKFTNSDFKPKNTSELLQTLENQEQSQQFWFEMENKCYLNIKPIKSILMQADYITQIKKLLQVKSNACVQLYLLEGYDFSSRDIASASDSYVKVTCGDSVFDERNNYKLNEPSPKIYKQFKFNVAFPGAPSLKIEAFDYDDLFGDDLIGNTYIDLDDRYFNPQWALLQDKPIEFRQLYHQSSKISQGLISMWLEIDDVQKKGEARVDWKLDVEPIKDYQIRVCIFDTQNIPCLDFEGTSDVYIKGHINNQDKQATDTHYRCMNGAASFNYRMVFDVNYPSKDCTLTLQAWDRDLFSKNDYICEWNLNLIDVLDLVHQSSMQLNVTQKVYANCKASFGNAVLEFEKDDTFWLTTTSQKDNKPVKIRLDLRILPISAAKQCAVGTGRNEPNLDPYLTHPVGRIAFTMNPCKMIDQLVSPAFKRKMCTYICIGLCIALCVSLIPLVFSSVFGNFVSWCFGLYGK